ncbi:fimbrial protein [Pseudomonas sp. GD04087]|uniref:fimbrial protein n=1 Tax=unclassified Pseudomonas TaxID=196821 RepID=UPI00244A9734|nr:MULTISPECIES: fimbrial protein [unclassified Pseudomonas]MDH0291353.1 fimbrial protein [Pseudomonas sp. GD04087]MDH1049436.1 fimbrial protein [Pseudomonas sp. GD03903]MDH2000070.1 fimbrial protein [Pseudomonas sp. GD03691]
MKANHRLLASFSLLTSILLSLFAGTVQADPTCKATAGVSISLPATFSAPRDRSEGTPLTAWTTGDAQVFNGCTASDTSNVWLQAAMLLTPTGKSVVNDGKTYSVFESGLRGVGLIMRTKSYSSSTWWPVEATPVDLYRGWGATWTASAAVRLVATGEPIASGVLSSQQIGEFTVKDKTSGNATLPSPIKITSSTVTAQTCSVDAGSKSFTVPVGKINVLDLAGPVGTTAGNASFNIRLDCSSGMDVFMTFTDASNPGNTSDRLGLSASSQQASGVALQVRRLGTPVKFGPDSSVAGNAGQIALGAAPNGALDIPLTANFIKTDAVVRGGDANAVATFTLSYQ